MDNNLTVGHVDHSCVMLSWPNGSPIIRLRPEDALSLAEELTKQADKILAVGVPPPEDE
jgi:hypothetical protein